MAENTLIGLDRVQQTPSIAIAQINLLLTLSDSLVLLGDTKGALNRATTAQALARKIVDNDPDNEDIQHLWFETTWRICDISTVQGAFVRALEECELSAQIARRACGKNPTDMQWQGDLSFAHNKIADLLQLQGKLDGALQEYEVEDRASFP